MSVETQFVELIVAKAVHEVNRLIEVGVTKIPAKGKVKIDTRLLSDEAILGIPDIESIFNISRETWLSIADRYKVPVKLNPRLKIDGTPHPNGAIHKYQYGAVKKAMVQYFNDKGVL